MKTSCDKPFSAASFNQEGLTLVELMVSALLLSLLVIGVATLMSTSSKSTRLTSKLSEQLTLIDSDLSRIRRASETYTSCPDGVLRVAPISPPCPHAVGTSDYYFPDPSVTGTTTAVASTSRNLFVQACTDGTLSSNLINYISTSIPITSEMSSSGIVRLIAKDDTSSSTRLVDHVIKITYSSPQLQRVFKINPAVAAWCP